MLKVIAPGFYTTLQDAGRRHWRHKGVPVSGTMDDLARHHVNTLLENPSDAAVLEITMTGPKLLFEQDTYICISGADISPGLNENPIQLYQVYKVVAGDLLSFGKLVKGFRTYLGIKGGFQTEAVLGSASQYPPVTEKKTIEENAGLSYPKVSHFEPRIPQIKTEDYLDALEIEVTEGPEWDLLTDTQKKLLFATDFTVSKENDRMAYRLEEKIGEHSYSMLTSAVLPGTVQMTPEGKLIVLMKDGQTTGGYLRILQLSTRAIAVMAQKKTADTLRFKRIQIR